MRPFAAILLITAIVLTMAVAPASAGYKDQWAKFRTTRTTPTLMKDKTDSKVICYVFKPWPWKCACDVDSDHDGVFDSKDKCPNTPKGCKVDAKGCPIDSDGDGVCDGLDQCPNTPKGCTVDAKGCPIDTDGDGVCDGIDQCPNTPAGAKVDAKGCPIDSDNDGVPDGIDQCPNTPKGCTVDSKGCPIDSDGDGVCDGIDKCPNTPAGTKVDETGCPVEVKKFIDTGLISSTEVLFDLGKATLKPESKAVLDKIGKILVQVPDTKVEIGGHTDATGSDKTNMKLSDDRANAVRDYLLKSFSALKADNLSAKGYGKTVPVASNDTKEGRAKNRRVEFKIMK
ncbi:MAG: OmpA family protein [Candidatus Krumholzibacteriaceae bacterium]|jgi:outer membrane protein OmpA-like peptidoglycan-associated protein